MVMSRDRRSFFAVILATAGTFFPLNHAKAAGHFAGPPSVSHPAPVFRSAPVGPGPSYHYPYSYSRFPSYPGRHFRNRTVHPFLGYDPFYTPNLLIPKPPFKPTFGVITGSDSCWLLDMLYRELPPDENTPETDRQPKRPPPAARKPHPQSAHITVTVPRRARLWFNEKKTVSRGRHRHYNTPLLEPGRQYTYVVRARWLKNGRQISQSRKVLVSAGERIQLTFPLKASR